ncbi:Cation channel sperm-associated protein 2 like protein [Aduncisulcus paluster]|uniref:Cation channel sperm-associated protein 2 like protein n=1 Tax=Aduncisulcus paluster TaxID=2918883 RepID=A0ABQ5KZP6_9EUKA|nr:Cation channel sperm-associated protein 2 like protein [Aduncisulcus paluster]
MHSQVSAGDEVNMSSRAAIFRNQLIEELNVDDEAFKLGKSAIYSTRDVLIDPNVFTNMLKENPYQLVRFGATQRKENGTQYDPRLRRLRNIYKIPVGVWAHEFVNYSSVQWFMTIVVVLNCILIGVEAELDEAKWYLMIQILRIIDNLFLVLYCLEIILKWIDSFKTFWLDAWNIADFVITITALPDFVLSLFGGGNDLLKAATSSLRLMRVLRVLRAIGRFRSLRVIMHTIMMALGSLINLIILLFLMMFIFALLGMTLFKSYVQSSRTDLLYKSHWDSLSNSLLSMFQMMTLDQWYFILQDVSQVVNPGVVLGFFLAWIWVGSFLFFNVFVGVMVKNFQSLKEDMAKKRAAEKKQQNLTKLQKDIARSITKRNKEDMKKLFRTETNPATCLRERFPGDRDGIPGGIGMEMGPEMAVPRTLGRPGSAIGLRPTSRDGEGGLEQQEMMTNRNPNEVLNSLFRLETSLDTLIKQKKECETKWPRDTLFRYFRVMEELQENIAEYEKLQVLVATSLHNMLDEAQKTGEMRIVHK